MMYMRLSQISEFHEFIATVDFRRATIQQPAFHPVLKF